MISMARGAGKIVRDLGAAGPAVSAISLAADSIAARRLFSLFLKRSIDHEARARPQSVVPQAAIGDARETASAMPSVRARAPDGQVLRWVVDISMVAFVGVPRVGREG